MNTIIKILFVCLGNICRSPAAHGVMEYLINIEYPNLKEKLYIDSCGTSDYNTGSLPDYRMIEEAGKRNILLNHRSRTINLDDLEKFDMIIAMDKSNYFDIVSMGADKNKVFQMINFVSDRKGLNEIPDPYYGYQDDFQLVLDLVYDGCKGILKYLKLI